MSNLNNVRFLKGIQQDSLVGIFLNGLKEDIKAKVKLSEPRNLAELMMKAQKVEEKVRVTSKGGSPTVHHNNNAYKSFSGDWKLFKRRGKFDGC
ncbi:hypothetical protein LR48_Vigan270s000800 [Vigna angularis]|uniref:Uncharacterized protein n=1 Tax=Phaseolus angularis TaxID=3914 RepID=A0A0L9T7S5_PHAAN|nr:hypothetical protein LR48_Vigan270s000800 [Vigna angularis]